MKTIPEGQEILSLFGFFQKTQALTQKNPRWGLAISLVSAFFIVLVAGLTLGLVQKTLVSEKSTIGLTASQQEAAAFVPGQFVSDFIEEKIGQGYLER